MAENGLSARALGEKSGLSGTAITLIVREKRSPGISTIEKICSGLGMTLSDFLKPVDANDPQENYAVLNDGTKIKLEDLPTTNPRVKKITGLLNALPEDTLIALENLILSFLAGK